MNINSREIGQAVFSATGFCASHTPQLNPLTLPLAKICATCGRKELLSGEELTWPWIAPMILPAKKSSLRTVKVVGIAGLALLAVLIIKQMTSLIASNSSSEQSGSAGNRLDRPGKSRAPEQKLALESSVLNGDSIVGNDSPSKTSAPVEADSSPGSADEAGDLGSGQTAPTPLLERQTTIQTDAGIPSSTGTSPVVSQMTQRQLPNNQESESKPGSPIHPLDETAQATRLERNRIEKRISEVIAIRAIGGVSVFFDGSTAYLKGVVRTESQKLAAEQAARAVRGVKKVNSRIRVDWQE